jgi:hypothetical protein
METLAFKTLITKLKEYLLAKNDSLTIYERAPYGVAGTNPEIYIHPFNRGLEMVQVKNTKDTYGVIISVEQTVSSESEQQTLLDAVDEILGYIKADDGYIELEGITFMAFKILVDFVRASEDASVQRAHIRLLLTNYQ